VVCIRKKHQGYGYNATGYVWKTIQEGAVHHKRTRGGRGRWIWSCQGDLAKRELTARGHRAESEATTHERVAGLQIYDTAGFGLDRRFGEKRRCCVNTDAWESVVLTIIAKTPLSQVFPSLHKNPIITSSGLLASPRVRSLLHAKSAGFACASTPPHALFDRHAPIVKNNCPLRCLPCALS
jgi:hypothetical protein